MKITRLFTIILACVWITSCAILKPPTIIKNDNIENYKYFYISPTNSLTSSVGVTYSSQYYSSSKSVNPSDVITGILAKEGYIRIPELKDDIINQTLIVNYGESGKRNIAGGL